MLVDHARFAHVDLVRVGERFVHPLVFEAVRCGVLHGLSSHVFERGGQHAVDLVKFVVADVVGALAWHLGVVHRRILVVLLAPVIVDHILQHLGGELRCSHIVYYLLDLIIY